MKTIASLLLATATLTAFPAAASTITWTGADELDHDGSVATAPTLAGQLVAIRGNARYDQLLGDGGATVNFGLHVNGQWQVVSSATRSASGTLNALLPKKSFAGVTFDAIGVNDGGGKSFGSELCPLVGGCFRGMQGTQFIFAKPREVLWTGSNVIGGTEELAVIPFSANRFLGATGAGAFGQMPGVPQFVQMWAHVDGVWTLVSGSAEGANGSLSSLFAPSSFKGGMIDKLAMVTDNRFGTRPNFSADTCDFFKGCFRNMDLMSFQFGAVGSVPEPSSWAMLIAGFGMAGSAMRRRRSVVAC